MERDQIGAGRFDAELAQEGSYLSTMIGAMVGEVLERRPRGIPKNIAFEISVLERMVEIGFRKARYVSR